MKMSVDDTTVHDLLNTEHNIVYRVPRYQREYSWQKTQWDELFDDLIESDEQGHFLGTIICVNKTENAHKASVLELIDGQQRMTTLSLLLAALHKELAEQAAAMDEDDRATLFTLRKHLSYSKNPYLPRLEPQHQNNNDDDYRNVLKDAGIPVDARPVAYLGNRRIMKAYRHFQSRIKTYSGNNNIRAIDSLFDLLGKIRRAVVVTIEVSSSSDAYLLFESLNNRGMPLTPIDLIKNTLLAQSETDAENDKLFAAWTGLLDDLGDNYTVQERFFRQFYAAFASELGSVPGVSAVTRSNLIRVYEHLIRNDRIDLTARLENAGHLYKRIIGEAPGNGKSAAKVDRELTRLSRAQGTSGHIVLLYLMTYQTARGLSDENLVTIIRALTSFMVRRHVTGTPATHRMARLFTEVAAEVRTQHGDEIVHTIQNRLATESADDTTFTKRLRGPIYEDNSELARFILSALAEATQTKESADLWSDSWSIEHIFPQGTNLPDSWVRMVGGDAAVAEIRENYLHTLGNLTLTAYNSSLSNHPFLEKRDHKNDNGIFTGFRNGLGLNTDLSDANAWRIDDIQARLNRLSTEAGELFQLPTDGTK